HGARFPLRSLVTVFLLQAVLNLLIAAPVYLAVLSPGPAAWTAWDGLGAATWAGGLYFEATADAQLRAFKAEPTNRGRIMDQGLWAWCRHPNYFGDALVWLGLGVLALGVPAGAVSLYGPALMVFFLMKVSGVPLLEKRMMQRPGYRDYAARTPAFFPRPPR
ncbi:MAG: DUF1295 domain-containing protein, partial [Myxococcales bacterium]|nr:DUF1295 domain-containing protein [Myxococcales bacterium]